MILLSILIPTLPERVEHFKHIRNRIISTCPDEYLEMIEIISDVRGREVSTGEKRNSLLEKSKGVYTWFIDDDDDIFDHSIKKIFDACLQGNDVIGINGTMSTDGIHEADWEIRLGHPYINKPKADGSPYYLRHPNHITPMKRAHAVKVRFPNIWLGEDYAWAKELHDSGHLKTESVINDKIYHYKYLTNK